MGASKRLHRVDRRLVRHAASWRPPWDRRLRAALETASEHTRVWWAAAALMAAAGGPRGRRAAAFGLVGMGLAEFLSNGVCKRVYHRHRPPEDLAPDEEACDRPNGSSFPSGHTAAAVGFAAAVAGVSPAWGAACAVPAGLVALERVHAASHYPSDVAAGAAIGAASAWLAHRAPRPPRALVARWAGRARRAVAAWR
ncbi:phosphatase PAP2 family protein [Streptomonospora nanhaiensis]|uniref:Undecaprenyl-diphosphatase n=1 Tax=Streptomonospora nanhaiensis TaxID=1323731 RepID=A0A853BKI8_9ACTN|nr:phosphatase PAP2 family protein [Streptomonospora nanhaiensis]MBV2364212.1 phosphatase PAP2 family protein [Streptomonospora nanhaiensis]MBX9386668.1 phosphatase PAP2 family protein [Streptomonospora nanhaiensis]NYI95167.1 undecaprenyl-diphosphatase [Streptomonospora nanhaiensis]